MGEPAIHVRSSSHRRRKLGSAQRLVQLGVALDIRVEGCERRMSVWSLASCNRINSTRLIVKARQILGPDVLPFLVPSLLAFMPPFPKLPSASPFGPDSSLVTSLVQADFDVLEESCMLIESLALDMEDVR